MRRMMGYENYIEHNWGKRGLPHKHPANGLNYTAHYPLERVDEMMTSKEWTRATFVRDPKERALSAYLMLKPTITVDDKVLKKARLGLYNQSTVTKNNNTVDLIRSLYPKMGPPQIVNCCRNRRPVMDMNWELLCINHILTFEGFLDVIDNTENKFTAIGKAKSPATKQHGNKVKVGSKFSAKTLRESAGCVDIHWSPLTHWRLDPRFYSTLNFVGHLDRAQYDTKRLLDRLDPSAWERFGASGCKISSDIYKWMHKLLYVSFLVVCLQYSHLVISL